MDERFPEEHENDDHRLPEEPDLSLSAHFNRLAEKGVAKLTPEEKTVFCDMEETLLLRRGINIPLYRVLLKFKEAGMKVVLFSDNSQKFGPDSGDLELAKGQLAEVRLDTSLLDQGVEDKILYKGKMLGLHIDDRTKAGQPNSAGGTWDIQSHTHWHPVEEALQDLQDLVQERGYTPNVPSFAKLER